MGCGPIVRGFESLRSPHNRLFGIMDLFYERMRQDVIEWYKEHYFSDRTDIVEDHLDALYHMYNPDRFISGVY